MITTLSSAVISDCGQYRYLLQREWCEHGFQRVKDGPITVFLMLNPSTADAKEDDPTIRRCMGFTNSWGHHRLMVVNLFAYRATDPKELLHADDPVGPDNDKYLKDVCACASVIVCAWGAKGWINDRANEAKLLLTLTKHKMYALGFTRGNHPKHPLYLPRDAKLEPMK